MFSVKDVCDIAVQIERNGEQVYRKAQKKITNNDLKELLGWMADEERRHRQWFEKFAGGENKTIENLQIEQMGKILLQDSVDEQTFSLNESELIQATTLIELIDQSIEFEKDTIIFYEMLREFIDDKIILEQLNAIIQEERAHISKLNLFMNSEEKREFKKRERK